MPDKKLNMLSEYKMEFAEDSYSEISIDSFDCTEITPKDDFTTQPTFCSIEDSPKFIVNVKSTVCKEFEIQDELNRLLLQASRENCLRITPKPVKNDLSETFIVTNTNNIKIKSNCFKDHNNKTTKHEYSFIDLKKEKTYNINGCLFYELIPEAEAESELEEFDFELFLQSHNDVPECKNGKNYIKCRRR